MQLTPVLFAGMGLGEQGDEFDTIAETIAESKPVPTSLDLGFDLDVDDASPQGTAHQVIILMSYF